MKTSLILFILLLSILSYGKTPLGIAVEVEADVNSDLDSITNNHPVLTRMQKRVDAAANGALNVAVGELKKKGKFELSDQIKTEWQMYYGSSLFASNRNIGDHKPVSQWLSDRYEQIELVLGKSFCINSHIADLKSLNFGVPVVFHPCNFPMDMIKDPRVVEYKRHFCGGTAGDDEYNGVLPVVSYWAVYVGCEAASQGLGFVAVCGMAATGVEKFIQNFVAGAVSDRIYNKSCGGK